MVASRRLTAVTLAALAAGSFLLTPVPQTPALAQDPAVPLTVDRWGGATMGVAVDGDRAYVAVGSSIATVDVSDAAAPQELARSVPERDLLTHLRMVAGHIVALGRTTGLTVFDVLDAVVPTAVARFATLGPAVDVFYDGTLAYVCDLKAGVRIVDLSDPRAPRLVGEWLPPDGHEAVRIAVDGGRAYVLAWATSPDAEVRYKLGARLTVLDLASLRVPVEISSQEIAPDAFVSDVAVRDGAVFIGLGGSGGILTIDARDPSRPAQRGILTWLATAEVLDIDGDILFVNGGGSSNGNGPLLLLDVSGPDPIATLLAQTEDKSVSIYGDGIGGVAVAEGRAYVATGRTLEILEVGQPFHDATLGAVQLVTGDDGSLTDVAAVDDLVLVAARKYGLRIVDGSDTSAPRAVTMLPPVTSDGIAPAVEHVALSGRTAYLTESGLGSGVRIVDVTDPSAPVVRGATAQPGYGGPPAVMGGYVIVPVKGGEVDDFGLRIIDVRNPAAPQAVGWLPLDHAPLSVAVAGTIAVVSSGGLVVVDLSEPRAPVRRGATDATARHAAGLAFDGRWAYAAAGEGLLTYDLTDLDRPRLTRRIQYVNGGHDLHIVGDTLYAADGGVVTALDLERPGEPRVRSAWRQPTGNRALAHADGAIWLVSRRGVLRTLDLGAPAGMTTTGEAWFEGLVASAGIDGNRVAAVTNWRWRRPLLTVFGGTPRPTVLGQSITTDIDQPLGSIVPDIDATVRDHHLWLTGVAPGFAAFDILDPAAVRRLTPDIGAPFEIYGRLQFAGDRAYASVGPSDRTTIGIFDVSAPALPRRVGVVTLGWGGISDRDWTVDGTTLWRLGGTGTNSTISHLYAIDAANPAAPREVAAIPLALHPDAPFDYWGMAAADGILLLFGRERGIVEVWDVRTPSTAHVVGQLDLHANIGEIAIADGIGWAAVYSDRVRVAVLDLSAPAAPREIGSVALADPIWGAEIKAAGRSAAVANQRGGLFVIRVGVPGDPPADATPQIIGRSPGSAPTPHEVLTPPPAPTPARPARPARVFFPVAARSARLAGPPSHLVLALDRSAAMGAWLADRAPDGRSAAGSTRFAAARALALAVAAGAAAASGGPTVSIVAYDRQAERLALGGPAALGRWLDARAPSTAALARHDVALAAAAADVESVAPSGCAFVALVTAAGASGIAAADRDASARAAALRAAGIRTLAVVVDGDGDGAADRAWLAELVGSAADVLSMQAVDEAAAVAQTLLARSAGCARR